MGLPGRLLFLTALGQTHLWLSSAKRNPTPGAPAQELALTKLMISPGAPGLPNAVRKFGVVWHIQTPGSTLAHQNRSNFKAFG